jgi:hypothetical protein
MCGGGAMRIFVKPGGLEVASPHILAIWNLDGLHPPPSKCTHGSNSNPTYNKLPGYCSSSRELVLDREVDIGTWPGQRILIGLDFTPLNKEMTCYNWNGFS